MHAQPQRCRPLGRQSDTLGQTHLDTCIQIHGDRQTQIQLHRDRYLDTLGTNTVDTLRYRNTETDTARSKYTERDTQPCQDRHSPRTHSSKYTETDTVR